MKSISLFFATVACCTFAAAAAETPVAFKSSRVDGQIDRVRILLEAGGDVNYAEEGKPQQAKTSVNCQLEFLEKTLEVAPGSARSIRDYQQTTAKVQIGQVKFQPTLKPEHRRVVAEGGEQKILLFSPDGNLSRDELDVIEIHADPLLLDRLLPDRAVSVGDRWEHSDQLMAAFLNLDEVGKTTVTSTLKEVNDRVARFELEGRVKGALHGIATSIEIKARYRFDRQRNRVDWLGMLVKEDRPSSFIDDGVALVSRLQLTITPADEPENLRAEALTKLQLQSRAPLAYLNYELAGSCRTLHDRRWFVYHQRPKVAASVLRLVDRGALAGQCNFAILPDRSPERLVSMDEFQADVRRALGDSFGEFVEAGQSVNEAKCRVLRVVVHGKASELPIRWIYYHVADQEGHQAALTFTVEQRLLEQFADADKPMIAALKFNDLKAGEKRETTEAAERTRAASKATTNR